MTYNELYKHCKEITCNIEMLAEVVNDNKEVAEKLRKEITLTVNKIVDEWNKPE